MSQEEKKSGESGEQATQKVGAAEGTSEGASQVGDVSSTGATSAPVEGAKGDEKTSTNTQSTAPAVQETSLAKAVRETKGKVKAKWESLPILAQVFMAIVIALTILFLSIPLAIISLSAAYCVNKHFKKQDEQKAIEAEKLKKEGKEPTKEPTQDEKAESLKTDEASKKAEPGQLEVAEQPEVEKDEKVAPSRKSSSEDVGERKPSPSLNSAQETTTVKPLVPPSVS